MTIPSIFVSKPHLLLFYTLREACFPRVEKGSLTFTYQQGLKQLPVQTALGLWDQAPTGTLPSHPIYKLVLQQLPGRKAPTELWEQRKEFWNQVFLGIHLEDSTDKTRDGKTHGQGLHSWHFSTASGMPWGLYHIS